MLLSNTIKASAAGVLGAFVLTAPHQTLKSGTTKAPALDTLGMQSIQRGAQALNQRPPEKLYEVAIAGDIISNAAYFAMVGIFGRVAAPITGTALGVVAGLGAIALPPHLGWMQMPLRGRAPRER